MNPIGRGFARVLTAGAAVAVLALSFGPALAQQGPIKIGMSLAQTGGVAAAGKQLLVAIQMWKDDVNAKGGLLGRQLDLEDGDSRRP